MKTKLALILFILISSSASAGELLKKAMDKKKNLDKSSVVKKPERSDQIHVIGLERTTHFVNERPAYCVIFRRNQSVSYEGINNVSSKGKYEGFVSKRTFGRMADFVFNSDYFDLPDIINSKTTDATNYVLFIETDKGEKIVWDQNFPEFANSTIWALGEMLDGVLSKIQLHKLKESESTRQVENTP